MANKYQWNDEKTNPRFELKWYHRIGDFANLFKAFIGTNYLTLAFGLKQSGLGAGLILFVVLGVLTDHCCGLIVKCKRLLIDDLCCNLMYKHRDLSTTSREGNTEFVKENVTLLRARLMKNLQYADIGKLTWGKYGSFFVNLFLVITQMGFCVNYYIFIGNTVHQLFPVKPIESRNASNLELPTLIPTTNSFSLSSAKDSEFVSTFADMNSTVRPPPEDSLVLNRSPRSSSNLSTATDLKYITYETTTLHTIPSTNNYNETNSTNSSDVAPMTMKSTAPALQLLVLLPMPIFILFTLFRNIRQMSLVSVVANLSCLVGFFSIVFYILIDFHVDDSFVWFHLATVPVLIGQLTASYEAIGTIIPIESSMEGNQQRFPSYLHGVVLVFSAMIAASSIIGYLNYGEATQQIITQNLPADDIIVVVINVTLIIGILCTYPLQIYPVIEILEFYLFTKGKIFGGITTEVSGGPGVSDESHPLLKSSSSQTLELSFNDSIALEVSSQVPAWKRNFLRAIIAIILGGFAVLLRNVFAYFNAFIGAVGSAPLSFVLPCLFHFTIVRRTASVAILAKDILIAILGLIFGVIGIVVSLQEMATHI